MFTTKNINILLTNYNTNLFFIYTFFFIFFIIKFLNSFSTFNLVKYFNYNIILDYPYPFKLKNKIPCEPCFYLSQKLPNKFEHPSNNPATEVMQSILDLHQDIMVYLFFFLGLIIWAAVDKVYTLSIGKKDIDNNITSNGITLTALSSMSLVSVCGICFLGLGFLYSGILFNDYFISSTITYDEEFYEIISKNSTIKERNMQLIDTKESILRELEKNKDNKTYCDEALAKYQWAFDEELKDPIPIDEHINVLKVDKPYSALGIGLVALGYLCAGIYILYS